MNAELRVHRSRRNVWRSISRRALARRVAAGAVGGGLLVLGRHGSRGAALAALGGAVVLWRALAGADDVGRVLQMRPRLNGRAPSALDDALSASFPASDTVVAGNG